MKQKVLMLFVLAWMAMGHGCRAQSLETAGSYPTGYMQTVYFTSGNTIMSIDGVLFMVSSGVPVTLVKYPAGNMREEYEVPSTVRRIMNNAFQGCKYLKTLKLHSEVSYGRNVSILIGETAFNDSSIENFVVIEDDSSVLSMASPPCGDEEKVETGRYNVQGMPVNKSNAGGLQIIRYSDGTTSKVFE